MLRKHTIDASGKRVPVYRTGLWPWRMAHEHPIPSDAVDTIRNLATSRWWRGFFAGVFVLAAVFTSLQTLALVLGASMGNPGSWLSTMGLVLVFFLPLMGFGYLHAIRRFAELAGAADLAIKKGLRDHGLCVSCGYALDGGTRCPECGAAWDRSAPLA